MRQRPWLAFVVGTIATFALTLAVALALDAPAQIPVTATGAVGLALWGWAYTTSRAAGVEAHYPGFGESFDLVIAAERWKLGRVVQFRLMPSTHRAWAPGQLGVVRGSVAFYPAKAAHASRAWGGAVDRVELFDILRSGSVLRVHGPDGSAQFSTLLPIDQLRDQLRPYLPLD